MAIRYAVITTEKRDLPVGRSFGARRVKVINQASGAEVHHEDTQGAVVTLTLPAGASYVVSVQDIDALGVALGEPASTAFEIPADPVPSFLATVSVAVVLEQPAV